jgi:cytochrome bd-type quinol oxidase subunit 2
LIRARGFRLADLMHKFSSRTMLIFVISLLLAVILLGLGTAYVSKLKQQRRQLSDNSLFNCGGLAVPLAESPVVRT